MTDMGVQWPSPDAPRSAVDAFIRALPPRVEDAPWGWAMYPGTSRMAPHEAPPMANGPSPVCNACGVVRVAVPTPFCRTCTAQIEAATGERFA